MDFLVRQAVTGSETTDTPITSKVLTLGSDADCDIVLPGVDCVLRVSRSKSSTVLKSNRKNLSVDGVLLRRAKLTDGQAVTVSGLTLGVFSPPSGFDVGVVIQGQVDHAQKLLAEVSKSVEPWSLRRMSWFLVLLVLTLGFLVPYLGAKDPQVAAFASSAGLPLDHAWSSGPLSEAHRAAGIELECAACHKEDFVMTQDEACLDCHQTIREHADIAVHANLGLEQMRCASCHREHNEPATVNPRDNRLCVDCHLTSDQWDTASEPVQAFAPDQHPQFKANIPRYDGHEWTTRRITLGDISAQDTSGLKFDHKVHLDASKVSFDRSGEAMVCSDCHSQSSQNASFLQINMEQHCSTCHSLAFDPLNPDVQLPHAKARDVYAVLEGHFMRQFSDMALIQDETEARRLPNRKKVMLECDGEALECAKEVAEREARYQFIDTGCVTCHSIDDLGGDNPAERYRVHPVAQQADWFAYANFDHKAHAEIGERFGDAVCLDCHAANDSSKAADILMPAIEECFDCHNANRSDIAVDCVSCHWFHQDDGPRSVLLRAENRLRNPNRDAWIYEWLK
jgi:predicted CXXCH cytochrome family protein